MLFEGTDEKANETKNGWYWLGSSYVGLYNDHVAFGLRKVEGGNVISKTLYDSHDVAWSFNHGVRPAVILRSDVEITKTGEGENETYEIN